MKTITVDNKDYTMEFTFAAAEHRGLVQKMFNILSGAYIVRHAKASDLDGKKKEEEGNDENKQNEDKSGTLMALIDGTSEMVAEIPHVCITAFYAGLLENNPLTEEEAKTVMKSYMKENKLSFNALYEELKQCMEDDGFFDLSGLTEMINKMNDGATEQTKKVVKKPQDHQKKQISTK